MPLPALVLAPDLSATGVNAAWVRLSGQSHNASRGRGWIDAVEPAHRERLLAQLAEGAAAPASGEADCRLGVRDGGARWTRWWWRPSSTECLVVCVADVEADRAREAALWRRATHDPLTGLVNREHFVELVQRGLDRAERSRLRMAVIYVDLDRFKLVNDSAGHLEGDRLLRAVALRLATAVRPTDVTARVGGDEFAVLCEALTDTHEAGVIAGRLRQAAAAPIQLADVSYVLGASTGVAIAGTGDTPELLIARADEAMYRAKRSARGREPLPHTPRGPSPATLATELGVTDGGGRTPATAGFDSGHAQVLVNRAFSITLTLQSAASLLDGVAAQRLQQAIDDLDGLIRDIEQTTLEPAPPIDLTDAADPAREPRRSAVAEAVAALRRGERAVATSWAAAIGDPTVGDDTRDRLAQAARLVRQALRALDAATVH